MSNEPDSPYGAPSSQIEPRPEPPDARGSRWAGFGLFWLVIVGGGFVTMLLVRPLSSLLGIYGPVYLLGTAAPWLAALALGIGYASKGKTRTAQGLLFGFLSLVGLALLFVAACFGIIAMNGGLGNMH